jgi:CRP/FNR family transcriptional regulator
MRKITCEACPVRGRSIACDVSSAGLSAFAAVGSSAVYRPRQVVFAEGGEVTGLYLVCHGQVKISCSDRFGREHILGLAGPGAVLGELSLDGTPVHAASAEATVESQLCFLPRARLVRFLESAPSVAIRIVAALSSELARSRRQVRDLALKSAESRLAAWILDRDGEAREARPQGVEPQPALPDAATGAIPSSKGPGNGRPAAQRRVTLACSRRDIAEMIGVSTETAIRLLARLRERGVIAIERGALVILDAERLARVARLDDVEA